MTRNEAIDIATKYVNGGPWYDRRVIDMLVELGILKLDTEDSVREEAVKALLNTSIITGSVYVEPHSARVIVRTLESKGFKIVKS